MKVRIKYFILGVKNQFKNLIILIGRLFWWIVPLALFILAICVPRLIWNLNFKDYLEFIKILIWPFTALVILFFFNKVITYLVFSINEFNFFGAKGELKNVQDLIGEKVKEKFEQEKKDNEYNFKTDKLLKEIGDKDNVARDVIKSWKVSIEDNKRLIEENKKLNEALERKGQLIGNRPFILGESELGTGNKLEDLSLGNPNKLQL